jgi:hypothetical protein
MRKKGYLCMAKRDPITWHPTDLVEVTNASGENLLLELGSGPLRLDSGRTLRLVASALSQPAVKALLDQGKITARPQK